MGLSFWSNASLDFAVNRIVDVANIYDQSTLSKTFTLCKGGPYVIS